MYQTKWCFSLKFEIQCLSNISISCVRTDADADSDMNDDVPAKIKCQETIRTSLIQRGANGFLTCEERVL